MVAVVEDKLAFGRDQVISATLASKNFGEVRRRARTTPLYVTDRNASIDTVIIGFDEFEQMAVELDRLRSQVVYAVASSRVAEAAADPAHAPLMMEDALTDEEYARALSADCDGEADEDLFE